MKASSSSTNRFPVRILRLVPVAPGEIPRLEWLTQTMPPDWGTDREKGLKFDADEAETIAQEVQGMPVSVLPERGESSSTVRGISRMRREEMHRRFLRRCGLE